jgi:hypothetical protein
VTDLHAAAQALGAAIVKRLPLVHREALKPEYVALRAALAAATEPPKCCEHPLDEHSYESNPEADPEHEPPWCDHEDCPCPGWGMAGPVPDPQGTDESPVNVTHLTPGQIAGAAEGIDMAERIVPVHIPTPDEPTDDDPPTDAGYWYERCQTAERERADWKRWCQEREAEVERLRAAAPASEDPPGVIFDGPPPRAIDVDPATIAPPVWGSPPPTPDPRPWSPLVERFRSALMREHADDWDMETVSEAAHICAHVMALIAQPDPDELIRRAEAADAERDAALDALAALAQPDREPLWRGKTIRVPRADDRRSSIGARLDVPPGTAVRVDHDHQSTESEHHHGQDQR